MEEKNQVKKLHLGCGKRAIKGWVNIDFNAGEHVDLVEDISLLPSFEPGTINTIYACHVLEHFKPAEGLTALKRWYDLLEPFGTIRLAVPDFGQVVLYYLMTKDITNIQSYLHGGLKDQYDIHYNTFSEAKLETWLAKTGFIDIKRYDWRKTEHFYMDDYSQAYLPHMDKVNGIQMSLNMEAIK